MPRRFTRDQLVRGPEPLGCVSGTEIKHLKLSFPDMLVDTQRTSQPCVSPRVTWTLQRFLWKRADLQRRRKQSARRAIEVFHNGRATNDETEAIALLARSLFAEGKLDQALKAIEQALAVPEKAEPNIRLTLRSQLFNIAFTTPS